MGIVALEHQDGMRKNKVGTPAKGIHRGSDKQRLQLPCGRSSIVMVAVQPRSFMRTPLKVMLSIATAAIALSACSIADSSPRDSPTPTLQPTQTSSPTYPASAKEPNVRLTVTTLKGNAAAQATRHLVCVGASAVDGTDFPDADQACSVLARKPSLLDYKSAETSEECHAVDQQNIADVFGEINGEAVRTNFRRDNSCNVGTWDELKSLLGTITEE